MTDACQIAENKKGPREGMQGRNYRIRMAFLVIVHAYIVLHFLAWYVFDFDVWGKTAMMGVPSLIVGNINAAAIMVTLILLSIPLLGRRFCGWVCHMRGAIELADWTMRKLGIQRYVGLKKRNTLINTRHRWMLRFGALFILLLPAILYTVNTPFSVKVNVASPPPYADLPGYENKLFAVARAPVNMDMEIVTANAVRNGDPTKPSQTFNAGHFAIALGMGLLIVFTMSFVLNYYYGHGAFCRILCPYVMILVPLMNLNPWQRKITRVDQCTGCRSCSNACPQGIDVSREIFHHNGKVTNIECIKCYACIDACDHGVLADTGRTAVAQIAPRNEYIRKPWLDPETKSLQKTEGIGPIWDFSSIIVALGSGWAMSVFGGFYFYVGAIVGFISFRAVAHRMAQMKITVSRPSPEQAD